MKERIKTKVGVLRRSGRLTVGVCGVSLKGRKVYDGKDWRKR